MSPEMICEGRLSPEVDIFSTGVLLHEMLTGQRAWHGLRWATTPAVAAVHTQPCPLSYLFVMPLN